MTPNHNAAHPRCEPEPGCDERSQCMSTQPDRVEDLDSGPFLLLQDHGPIRVITLNRPRRKNAIDSHGRIELLNALREAESQSRAIVLTGAGDVFSAGGDIRSMSDDPAVAGSRLDALGAIAHQLVHSSVPVIAAVEGGAFGAGLSIVSACTYVVSGRSARFVASFANIGLGPDTGLTWTLPRRIGSSRARRMMLMLLTLEGDDALHAGLVDELVDDGTAFDCAMSVASHLVELSAPMIAGLSELLAGESATVADAAAAEARLQVKLLGSDESRERRARFLGRVEDSQARR